MIQIKMWSCCEYGVVADCVLCDATLIPGCL